MSKVGIIIVNYNEDKLTEDCIKSIDESRTIIPYEIILINNSPSRLREISKFNNSSNIGFSKAVNQGIEYCFKNNFDYVYLLNNDTKVTKGFLDSSIELCEKRKEIGIVGSKQLNFDRKDSISYGNITPFGVNYYSGSIQKEVNWISGAGVLIKMEVIKSIGNLDERYSPAYYEETDFEFRAKKRGFILLANPNSIIYHKGSETSNKVFNSDEFYEIFQRNRIRFFITHFGIIGYFPRFIQDLLNAIKQKRFKIFLNTLNNSLKTVEVNKE